MISFCCFTFSCCLNFDLEHRQRRNQMLENFADQLKELEVKQIEQRQRLKETLLSQKYENRRQARPPTKKTERP